MLTESGFQRPCRTSNVLRSPLPSTFSTPFGTANTVHYTRSCAGDVGGDWESLPSKVAGVGGGVNGVRASRTVNSFSTSFKPS